jgi:hypothetical protein
MAATNSAASRPTGASGSRADAVGSRVLGHGGGSDDGQQGDTKQ